MKELIELLRNADPADLQKISKAYSGDELREAAKSLNLSAAGSKLELAAAISKTEAPSIAAPDEYEEEREPEELTPKQKKLEQLKHAHAALVDQIKEIDTEIHALVSPPVQKVPSQATLLRQVAEHNRKQKEVEAKTEEG